MSDVDVIDEGVDVVQLDDVVRKAGAPRRPLRAHRTIVRQAWGMLALSVAIQVLATTVGVWLALWVFGATPGRCGPSGLQQGAAMVADRSHKPDIAGSIPAPATRVVVRRAGVTEASPPPGRDHGADGGSTPPHGDGGASR